MKFLVLIFTLFMVGCTIEPPPEIKAAMAKRDAEFEKGPTRKPGCYKVINKKSHLYGCTFQSTQGSMFTRDGREGSEPKWRLIFNRRIRCLVDRAFFVDEQDVKPIKCPDYLYHDSKHKDCK